MVSQNEVKNVFSFGCEKRNGITATKTLEIYKILSKYTIKQLQLRIQLYSINKITTGGTNIVFREGKNSLIGSYSNHSYSIPINT